MAETIDSEALATLVERHRRFLRFLESRLGRRAAAEKLLQAAFVKGLEGDGDIRDGENAVAWFYRFLRTAFVDHWRHRDAEQRALESAGGGARRRGRTTARARGRGLSVSARFDRDVEGRVRGRSEEDGRCIHLRMNRDGPA